MTILRRQFRKLDVRKSEALLHTEYGVLVAGFASISYELHAPRPLPRKILQLKDKEEERKKNLCSGAVSAKHRKTFVTFV